MPTILVHHDVDDTEHWLASPKREEFFGPLGITNIRKFTNPQNPTQVGLMLDVPDLEALTAALETPEAAATMRTTACTPTPWSFSSSPSRGRRSSPTNYSPSCLPRISFMISSVPPPIGPRRMSRATRSISYSFM